MNWRPRLVKRVSPIPMGHGPIWESHRSTSGVPYTNPYAKSTKWREGAEQEWVPIQILFLRILPPPPPQCRSAVVPAALLQCRHSSRRRLCFCGAGLSCPAPMRGLCRPSTLVSHSSLRRQSSWYGALPRFSLFPCLCPLPSFFYRITVYLFFCSWNSVPVFWLSYNGSVFVRKEF